MAPSLLSALAALMLFACRTSATEYQISQISDGQVQVGSATTPSEDTSTTFQTSTASAIISIPPLDTTAVVAALPSTTPNKLPTSIMVAAPAGAPGAASNYTGLDTVTPAPFPTPRVPIPVNGTIPALGGINGTSVPSGTTAVVPTTTEAGGSPTGTTTEGPLGATGAAVRLANPVAGKEMLAVGIMAWAIASL